MKTGRTLDMLDLDGRAGRRRRGKRIRGVIGMVIVAAITVATSSYAVVASFSLVRDQGRLNSYDKAGYCVSDVTNQTDTCVLRTTANVAYIDVYKNTGKNAHGYTTRARLEPQAGQSLSVVLSSTKNVSSQINEGDSMPVLVWHDQITRFTFAGKTHDSDENPHHIVNVDLGLLALVLLVATAFGRPLIRRLLRDRIAINLRRNRVPDWTLVALGVATALAALLRASYVVAALNVVGVAVLALSVAWPFIPWVATPSAVAVQPLLIGKRTATPKRNQKRRQLP